MSNRQVQRDARREQRQKQRQQARREVRLSRAPERTQPDVAPAGRRIPWAWIGVGVVAIVVAGAGLVLAIKQNSVPLPGAAYASLGNQHIEPGSAHPPYNSNTPTSGWHYPTWPKRGICTEVLPEEWLLHFQEHAGMVVHYNPDTLPPDEVAALRKVVNRELNTGQGLIVMSPDPNIPDPVALTSWQHLQTFAAVTGNQSKIEDFTERLQCNYDPEGVCGPPHGTSFQPTGTPVPGVATVIGAPLPGGAVPGTAAPGQRTESGTPAAATATP